MTRSLKKFLYGILYIFVLFVLIVWFYNSSIKPAPTCTDNRQNQGEIGVDCGGPCVSCEIKNIKQLRVLTAPDFFGLDSGRAVVLAEVVNPNQNYDAADFAYTIDIYNSSGDIVETESGRDFVSRSNKKYIFEPDIRTPFFKITSVGINFSDVNWKPSNEALNPNLTVSNISTESGNSKNIKVLGSVQNDSAVNTKEVKLIAVLFDSFGNRIFASQTILSDMSPFESRSFSIAFPKDPNILQNISKDKTQIFAY